MEATQKNLEKNRLIKEVDKIVVRFSGDSGDGMQLTGMQFTETAAFLGNDLSTFPDYPSEIRAPIGTVAGVSVFQNIGAIRIMGEFQIFGIEALRIGNDNAAAFQFWKINFKRRGVHGYQHIILVAGCINFCAAKMHLEAGDSGHRSYRRPYLGGIIRKSAQVIA